MPSSNPCRRRISWQPAMTPWKSLAASKIAALQSVTCASSAKSSADTSFLATAAWMRSNSSTARLTHTLQWPSSPPLMHGVLAAIRRHGEGGDEVEDGVIVVAGIERDPVGGIRFYHAAHHVDGAVAVERRDLDGDHVLDRREATPERHRQHEAAHGGLQVEADEGKLARDRLRVRDQLVFARALEFGERKEPGVIAKPTRDLRLLDRLHGAADEPRDHDFGRARPFLGAAHGELQHRLEQGGLADRELGGVDADREPARAGVE